MKNSFDLNFVLFQIGQMGQIQNIWLKGEQLKRAEWVNRVESFIQPLK